MGVRFKNNVGGNGSGEPINFASPDNSISIYKDQETLLTEVKQNNFLGMTASIDECWLLCKIIDEDPDFANCINIFGSTKAGNSFTFSISFDYSFGLNKIVRIAAFGDVISDLTLRYYVYEKEERGDKYVLFYFNNSGDIQNNVVYLYTQTGKDILAYQIEEGFAVTYTSNTLYLKDYVAPSVGVTMIETTYDELKAWRDASQLVAGCKYRITDYECTSSDEETQCAGHNYDIIVTALSSDTLAEECNAIQHEGDTYFNGQNLNSWKVWYCLDNDRTSWGKEEGEFVRVDYYGDIVRCKIVDKTSSDYDGLPIKTTAIYYDEKIELYLPLNYEGVDIDGLVVYSDGYEEEATFDSVEYLGVQVGGKGVVYRLIDDKGNDVSYDFKNLMFKRYKITSEDYQFFDMYKGVKNNENYEIDEEDYKFFYTFSIGEEEGNIDDYSLSSFVYDNKLNAKGTYNNIFSNTLGDYCEFNTFGDSCHYNTFGSNCYLNTLGDYCNYNTFGSNCYLNTLGDYCNFNNSNSNCSNTLGDSCEFNTFGDGCFYNTFGFQCRYNTFGYQCRFNTFGDSCEFNTLGDSCEFNTFGNDCLQNTFDITKIYNSCVVLDNVQYVNFSFVDHQVGTLNKYVQYCGYNSQGELKYWTPADLVQ